MSSAWNVAGNWTAGVPTSGVPTIIAPAANQPTTTGVLAPICGTLTVQVGATLTAQVPNALAVIGSVSCAGAVVGELRLFGGGTIATSGAGLLGDVLVQTGAYTVTAAVVTGRLDTGVSAGALTVQSATVQGTCSIFGAGLTGGPNSTLSVAGGMTLSSSVPITAPPTTMVVSTIWTSNASWQPASGLVLFDVNAFAVNVAPGTVFHDVDVQPQFGIAWNGDLRVAGALHMRGDITVSGTTIDLTQRLTMTFDSLLDGNAVTQLRLHNGVTSAGVISLPNATLDADGDVTFFVSGSLHLGPGVHTLSNSFGMPGTLTTAPGSSFLFDGAGLIVVAFTNSMASVTVSGSYTIRTAHIVGNLTQQSLAGTLGIGRVIVDGTTTFQGATVIDDGIGTLDANGNMFWQTTGSVTTPPATVLCSGNWTSNGNFLPTTGLVVFDGTGAKTVTTPTFAWQNLRIGVNSQVLTSLPVLTNGLLDVQGTLNTTGNDVEVFGPLTVSGSLVATSSLRLRTHGGATVSGSVQMGAARLDDDGNVSVSGTMALGNGVHQIAGSTTVTGALTMPASQLLQFDGTGTVDIVASNPIPDVAFIGGNHDVLSLVVGRDLLHQSGTLRIRTCVVGRDATMLGSGLQNLGNGLLDIGRQATLQLTGAVTAPPATISCAGSWISSATFTPASGLVVFDGLGAQSIGAAPTVWHDLRIGANSTSSLGQDLMTSGFVDVQGILQVAGTTIQVGSDLFVPVGGSLSGLSATTLTVASTTAVGGTVQVPVAAFAGTGDVNVDNGATMNLGGGVHTFQSSLSVQGALVAPGSADFQFLGSGSILVVPTATVLPTALVGGADYKVVQLEVQGLFRHTAGRLIVNQLTGQGAALIQGGSLEGGVGDIMDISGDVTLATSGVTVSPPGTIRCGGNWSSNAQFLPTSGTIEMTGSGPHTMTTTAQLFLSSLIVSAPTQLALPAGDVILQHDLQVLGSLAAPTNLLEIRGNLLVPATGSVALPASCSCRVALAVTNAGAIGPTGTLKMVGSGSITGAGSFPNVAIDSPAEVQLLGNLTLAHDLALVNGTMRLGSGASVHVLGHLNGTGGVLRGLAGSLLDVDGHVALAGVAAHPTEVPDIDCGSDWTADAAFAPTLGTTRLDGSGSIGATTGPLHFAHLQLAAGVHTIGANLTMTALDVAIQSGAALHQGGRSLQVTASTMTIGGDLDVQAGGVLFLGAGTAVTVAGSGHLTLLGTISSPARIDGPSGGGYSFVVNGTIEAMNFACAHMGPGGIRVNAAATIAAAPHDFRGGAFGSGDAAPGSCLLHFDRSSPAQIRYVRFDNAGSVTFNVRSTGTAAVDIVNDEGTFTGQSHEDDAGNVVNWLPPQHTIVSRFSSDAAVHRVELALATAAEFDVQRLHLSRSENPGGPFVEILGSPYLASGSPTLGANYALTDFSVVDTTRYFYRVDEELTHGLVRTLDQDFARPWPQQFSTVWFVGTNGGYPDIASAVAAAPVGANILVQAGTYPAFTLNKAVRIAPDGSGPVNIDTSLGKFVIRDINAGSTWVELFDLHIGSGTSAFGMEVVNCDNILVFDGLDIATATGVTGLLVDDTTHIAIQNCTISGDPGLRFQSNSSSYLSRGSVDELDVTGNSDITRCGVVPGTETVAPGSHVTALAGGMPGVQFPITWVSDKAKTVTIVTDPNSAYLLFMSFGRDYFQIGDVFPFIDMVLLIDQTQAQMLMSGVSPSGTVSTLVPGPGDLSLWGASATVQVFELKVSNQGRLSTSRTAIFVP